LREVLAVSHDEPLIAPGFWLPAVKRSSAATTHAQLLDYVRHSLESGWRPTEEELGELLKTLPDEHGDKAQSIRQLHRQAIDAQRARLQEFEAALGEGDAARGRAVFFSKQATCSVCHRVGGEGGRVGPDLSKIGAIRSGRDLLESIVLPSSTIAQGYDSYVVATHDGRSANGVLARDVDEVIVLRDSSGAESRIRRDQIAGMSRASTSVMPEGLARSLAPHDLRHLLAFLQSLK
jgi:putative heme-binding domain-containing protein